MAVDVGTGVKEPAVSEAGRGAPDGEKFGQGRVLSAIAEHRRRPVASVREVRCAPERVGEVPEVRTEVPAGKPDSAHENVLAPQPDDQRGKPDGIETFPVRRHVQAVEENRAEFGKNVVPFRLRNGNREKGGGLDGVKVVRRRAFARFGEEMAR